MQNKVITDFGARLTWLKICKHHGECTGCRMAVMEVKIATTYNGYCVVVISHERGSRLEEVY